MYYIYCVAILIRTTLCITELYATFYLNGLYNKHVSESLGFYMQKLLKVYLYRLHLADFFSRSV